MEALHRLIETVARLRAPGGCPWDREQTHESLTPCLVEECSEVLEAIDNRDDDLLEEELGDLLLNVLMHAEIAREEERFDLESVATRINDKLIRRHPHVFGPDATTMSTDAVLGQWERIKREEKGGAGASPDAEAPFKKLPPRLPATAYALEVGKRVAKLGLGTGPAFREDAIAAKTEAAATADAAGAELFEWVEACRRRGWDPEALLRRHADQVKAECRKLGTVGRA